MILARTLGDHARRARADGGTAAMLNRSFMGVVMLAAAGAATGWLVRNWLEHQERHRKREKLELKERLRTWEEEGGSLAPGVERRDAPVH